MIIPCCNEEEGLKKLLPEIKKHLVCIDYELIVIDDGSNDKTQIIAKKYADKILVNNEKKGKTKALEKGLKHAEKEYLILFDGDYQHKPEDILKVLKSLEEGAYFVNGWRKNLKRNIIKRMQSRAYNALMRILSKSRIHDHNCPLKGFKKEVIKTFDFSVEGYHRFWVAMAEKKGYEIMEVSVDEMPRQFGKSHYNNLDRIPIGLTQMITLKFKGKI